jgi:hypothetical protein
MNRADNNMDPMLTNQEQNMREEMLRHEFPFDPKAWEAMEQLLDEKRDPLPPAAPAASPTEQQPGPGSGRIWLLLLVALLGACLASLKLTYQTRQEAVSGSAEAPNTGLTPENQGRNITNAANESSTRVTADIPDYSNQRINEPTGQTAPGALPGSGNRQSNQVINPTAGQLFRQSTYPSATTVPAGTTGFPSEGMTARAPGSETIPPVQKFVTTETRDFHDILPGTDNTISTGANEYVEPATALSPAPSDGAPERLPVLPMNPLGMPTRSDSIIRPVPFAPAETTRWERGWLFGAGVNTVDYRPLRLRVAPHFGYFMRRRITPRTSLQSELALKFVPGYNWRAEFYDVVPGGSSQVILETDRLLYIELPLLLQRSWSPGHAWLLGLKPALTLPISPFGSFSSVNSGAPNRDYSMHEGFRYIDLGLVLGWEYRFGRRWALDIRYNQGLFDLTADNFYHQREMHLNSDLQVSLRYFFIKKIRKHEPATLFPAPPARR